MPNILGSGSVKETTNSFQSALLITPNSFTGSIMFVLNELNIGPIEYEVLGSVDGLNWVTVIPTGDLSRDAIIALPPITSPWIHLDCQVRSDSENTPGSVTVLASG